jgi:putative hydrolase of the HAD superfamily
LREDPRVARTTRAVLLDALGTLVRLDPPAPRLREELARRGVRVDAGAAERAFAAEIAYYVEHHTQGRDEGSLAELRDRCAAVLQAALGVPQLALPPVREAMLASIVFEAYPDAAPALEELRGRGLRLVAASNWDCSLPRVLDGAGLGELLDGVATSAAVGARKPDPALLEAALGLAGCAPDEAVHVGDSLENDVRGALAAGIRVVLVDRTGSTRDAAGIPVVSGLAELASLI